ncbi:MAG TPA: ABC transporter ATP-binding protein [Lachnoclostridium sp.]|uniref:ABC transporter ATP-binding protein n=1 Tax=Lacrimispora sp. TaxID=2719234 RepID=UPI000EDDE4C0|nr:ABC transporter ATP-binding protein [Lacrimispora sp.]HCD45815.1 ABC transporter ATP-binding protein [Lachnoclostridium sp.]
MNENPMKKGRKFYIGMILTVVEGMLSGCNYFVLYEVMKMLWAENAGLPRMMRLALFLGIIFVSRIVIYSLGYTSNQIGGAAVSKKVRLFLGDKIKKIPLSRFTQGQTGQYINIATSDVNSYEKILTHTIGNLVKNITFSVMLILFVGYIWLPGGIILACIELLLVPSLWLAFRVVKKYGTEKNAVCAENVSSIVEYVTGIQTFRAYGVGGTKNKTVTSSMKEFCDVSYDYEKHGIPVNVVQCICIWAGLPIMILAASVPMLNGTLTPTSYLLISILPMLLAKLADAISRDLMSYKNLMISKIKVMDIMKEKEETGSMETFTPKTHDIEFQNVEFSYVPGEPVLQGISFTVPDQKLTAIVGDSGSGKSTILNLISKYYEAQAGTISIGGQPIQNAAPERILEQISMVDQDVFLFDDTIRDNIRHARPNAADAEIEAACKEANCDGFIRKMEKGYDTPTGENGNLLSGGERQRLSIARAILKNSPILLLDEATASLDIENELAVKQAIANLMKAKKTVVMIAHTLSIVKHADQILVVADGRIAEAGTHEELLKKNGKYASMWNAEQQLSA